MRGYAIRSSCVASLTFRPAAVFLHARAGQKYRNWAEPSKPMHNHIRRLCAYAHTKPLPLGLQHGCQTIITGYRGECVMNSRYLRIGVFILDNLAQGFRRPTASVQLSLSHLNLTLSHKNAAVPDEDQSNFRMLRLPVQRLTKILSFLELHCRCQKLSEMVTIISRSNRKISGKAPS